MQLDLVHRPCYREEEGDYLDKRKESPPHWSEESGRCQKETAIHFRSGEEGWSDLPTWAKVMTGMTVSPTMRAGTSGKE